jgi:carboxylate-amine ligase
MVKIVNVAKKQSKKRPLKRSMTGLEFESHVIDEAGKISYKGYNLVRKIKKSYPEIDIVKECGKNMIEINCYPDIKTYNPALELINGIQRTIKIAKNNKLRIYPFGTYPGSYPPRFTPSPDGKYKIQERIFGAEKFGFATKVVGFHHHYAFPKGVFDEKRKKLKLLLDSKLKRSLLNSYNFEIAIDPILVLLSQSSPFLDGKLIGKDARILAYRGGKKLGYNGMYSNFQQFGGLPPYKQTATDLIRSLNKRKQRWRRLIKKADPSADMRKLYPIDLDISWNPVKINKHGTLEHRGMDANYLSVLLGISALVKFCLKKIQREFVEAIPSDIGIDEPFKIRRGIMFIPPHTHVRNVLQRASAYDGFQNDELYEYAKKFYRFAKSVSPEHYYPLFWKIEDMLKKRKSVSDEIIEYSKRKGYITKAGTISNRNSRALAIYLSGKFEKDLKETKKIVRNISKYHTENISKK